MLTRNAKYFKAGVAIAPCTDFRLYDTAYTERSMGMPQKQIKLVMTPQVFYLGFIKWKGAYF